MEFKLSLVRKHAAEHATLLAKCKELSERLAVAKTWRTHKGENLNTGSLDSRYMDGTRGCGEIHD